MAAKAPRAAAAANPWRPLLYRLRGQPLPIYLFAAATLPAASLWSGARGLAAAAGAGPSLLDGAPGPAWLQAAVAALFAGRPLCVAADPARAAAQLAGGLPAGAVLAVDADGAATAVPFAEVLAAGRAAPPDHLVLPDRDWHRPDHLRAVLQSLVVPTHVFCGFAP